MLKKISISLALCALVAVGMIAWLQSMIPGTEERAALKQSSAADIPYLQNAIKADRGRILAVVTSTDTMGESGKSTGFELTELARAYYVFTANGFEVDIASPSGGEPPMVIDGDDMGTYDYAFLNDDEAQAKLANSIPLNEAQSEDYAALYFVGGKGAMFDFPDNEEIKTLVAEVYQAGGVIAAVCHCMTVQTCWQTSGSAALPTRRNSSSSPRQGRCFHFCLKTVWLKAVPALRPDRVTLSRSATIQG